MGTTLGVAENDGGIFEESVDLTTSSSLSSTKEVGNPVMYKLVRVEGDGRLVPATDDEIMEVKDLLENEKTDMHNVTATGQNLKCISDGGVSSGLPQLESSEGLSQSDNIGPDVDKSYSQFEYIEERLQKVKEEEKRCFTCGSPTLSAHVNVNIQCTDQNDDLPGGEDKLQSETPLQEPIPFLLRSLDDRPVNQPMEGGECSNADGSKEVVSLTPGFSSSLKPDFSKLEGEICLDNLTIRELQETFRATFGRETTVKDKLWLKRRIAMGLTNSYDIPNTSFIIKDNKLVKGKEENSNDVSSAFTKETTSEARADDNCKYSSATLCNQEGNQSASGNSPGDNFRNYERGSGDFDIEHRAVKRLRKPTRRFIEELSEKESKHPGGKLIASPKGPRPAPKSQIRSDTKVSSGGRIVVTRMVSLAGSRIQVPCVSQVRRSRPRENIMALMEVPWETEKGNRILIMEPASEQSQQEFVAEPRHSKRKTAIGPVEVRHSMGLRHVNLCGGKGLEDNVVSFQTVSGGFRRKHHRAWTLSEVTKLVDGVSKYGAGKWSEIKRLSFSSYSYRTSVDLKDKWRNLLKASFAKTPSDKGGNMRKPGSTPIPTPILLRVKELAEKQAQLHPNRSPSKPAGDSGEIVNDNKSGFL